MNRAAPSMADPLLAARDEFPGLDRVLHFISHSLGAMPGGAVEMLERYARASRPPRAIACRPHLFRPSWCWPTHAGCARARVCAS